VSHKPECNEKWEYDKDHCICSWIEKAEKRIIKLLKKNLKTAQGLMGYSVNVALTESYLHGLEQSIALIKGEK
jgi:hypothetical protein